MVVAEVRWLLGCVMLGALLLSVGGALLISRSITRPLGGEPDDLVRAADAVASGDLSLTLAVPAGDTHSAMARMAAMQSALASVVANVRANSESVATASAQIAQGNQDLSQRTEEQASALQQTAATMEQLSTTVNNNTDSEKQANQLAQGALSDDQAVGPVLALKTAGTLPEKPDGVASWWANELHPTPRGFRRIAEHKFIPELKKTITT